MEHAPVTTIDDVEVARARLEATGGIEDNYPDEPADQMLSGRDGDEDIIEHEVRISKETKLSSCVLSAQQTLIPLPLNAAVDSSVNVKDMDDVDSEQYSNDADEFADGEDVPRITSQDL